MRTHHHTIARGMLVVMLFVVLAKLVAMAKEMAVAWRFGVGEVVDGYLFVFNLVSWPVSVWLSVLAVVLVPLATRLRREDAAGLSVFRAELLGLTLLIGAMLALAAWLGLPVLLRAEWLGLAPGVRVVALDAVPMLALVPLIGLPIGLYSVWMLSRERHANTLYEGLPALGILIAVMLLPFDGVAPLLWGTLAGMAFQLAAVVLPSARDKEFGMPGFRRTSSHWPAFWQGFGIMMLGQAIMSLTAIIDQFFVAGLGSGAISTLGYANRVMALILGLGATAVSRATLPVLSQAPNRSLVLLWSGVMLLISLLTLVVSWQLAPWVVSTIFQRGAFSFHDANAVTEVFRFGLYQLPGYFSGIVLVAWMASTGQYNVLLKASFIGLMVKLVANWLLLESFGLSGVVLATAIMYATTTGYLFLHYARFGRGLVVPGQ
jgi:peptidoglycan biosynthesis protein MviN/MurJ (putative lipid II flippase)